MLGKTGSGDAVLEGNVLVATITGVMGTVTTRFERRGDALVGVVYGISMILRRR